MAEPATAQLDSIEPRAVLIPPGCRHRAVGDLRALVVAIPAADDEDEFFDDV